MAPQAVLETLRQLWMVLQQNKVPAAVVGGLALAAWKHPRTTLDVDVLLPEDPFLIACPHKQPIEIRPRRRFVIDSELRPATVRVHCDTERLAGHLDAVGFEPPHCQLFTAVTGDLSENRDMRVLYPGIDARR